MPYSHQGAQAVQRPGEDAWERLRLGLINLLAFALAYGSAHVRDLTTPATHHFSLPLDASVPMWPLMVWPYLCSVPLLMACFCLAPAGEPLRTFSRRMLCVTALAGLCFAFFPAINTFPPPDPAAGLSSALLHLLDDVDGRGNQLPSLHVAYAVLAMTLTRFLRPGLRNVARVFLSVVAISAVMTHRHHLADAAVALVMTWIVMHVVKPDRPTPDVALHYFCFGVLAFSTARNLGWVWAGAYLAASLIRVAWAYERNDAAFAHKEDGRLPWHAWLVLAPWLIGYRITWCLQRMRTRGLSPFQRWHPDLWVGRRLTENESARLPRPLSVIDLSAELSETASLRTQHYHHVPLLDLRLPSEDSLRDISAIIAEERAAGRHVYLHCSMGIARSIQVANAIAPFRTSR